MSIIKSIKGLFGQTIHYKNGIKVGETWDSFIPGVKNHYDVSGEHVGYSAKCVFADELHYDNNGEYLGVSHKGLFDSVHHYGRNGSRSVSSPGLFGTNTFIPDDNDTLLFSDSDDSSFEASDSFDSDW